MSAMYVARMISTLHPPLSGAEASKDAQSAARLVFERCYVFSEQQLVVHMDTQDADAPNQGVAGPGGQGWLAKAAGGLDEGGPSLAAAVDPFGLKRHPTHKWRSAAWLSGNPDTLRFIRTEYQVFFSKVLPHRGGCCRAPCFHRTPGLSSF